jgi:hypothetical protein
MLSGYHQRSTLSDTEDLPIKSLEPIGATRWNVEKYIVEFIRELLDVSGSM